MAVTATPAIAKLSSEHDPSRFDCGQPALDTFIRRHALLSQGAQGSQTYVAAVGPVIVGYHTLVVGEVAYDDAPERLAKGLSRHPVLWLARLAVDRSWQGRGLGAALVADALRAPYRWRISPACAPS